MIIKKFYILFFLCSFIAGENLNSIFYSSKSPRVNSLGSCIFNSNDISDVLNNPLDLNYNIIDKTYFSYYNYLNNSINIFQISQNIFNKENFVFNIGLVGRIIDDIYNTEQAWNNSYNLQYEDINYSLINTFDDNEFGIVFSLDRKIKDYILSSKIKPIVHYINSNRGLGISADIFICKKLNNINLMVGFKDLYYMNWDKDYFEKSPFKFLLSAGYNFENIFIVANYLEENRKIGLEYKMFEEIFIRFGYNELNKYTYGFGIQTDFLSVNYSYNYLYNLSSTVNQFSLAFNF